MAAKVRDSRAPRGLFVGLTTVDVIFSFARFPKEDTKNTADRYAIAAGGPASNAAVAFSYLGGTAHLISALGRSSLAALAKRDLKRYHVRHIDLTETRVDDPAFSAVTISEESGSRTILTSPVINDDLRSVDNGERWASVVDSVDIVLLDGHQTRVAEVIASRAKEGGKPVVLDGDLYKPDLEAVLPMVDVAIFGKSFAVPGVEHSVDLLKYFASHGVAEVAATNGARTIRFLSGGAMGRVDVEPVNAVDTLAAGDFLHGAFCFRLTQGLGLEKALRLASDVARRSVSHFGTRAWMEEYGSTGRT
ncbi:MAG: PfkB family carbohydrate kinase [Pseudonocardiaceae bacterium]